MADYGIDECFTDIDDALKRNPDMAIIAGPSNVHISMGMLLARQGVHLLIEKPLSADLNHVDELIRLCNSKHTCLMVGYNMRFNPALIYFVHAVQEGIIGRVLSVHAEVGQHLMGWRKQQDYRASVSARKSLGGGVLLELSHEIDYLNWIFDKPSHVNGVVLHQSELEIDVEDSVHAFIEWHDETGRMINGILSMDFYRHDPTRFCHIVGTEGSLRWDGISGTVEWFDSRKSKWETLANHADGMAESYRYELEHFVSCVQLGRSPQISGEDGKRVLQVVEALRRSGALAAKVAVSD